MTLQIPERPKIRPGLAAAADENDPSYIVIWDQLKISSHFVRMPRAHFELVSRMNGSRSLRDLQADVMRATGGLLVPLDGFADLVAQLDSILFLDSPRFAEYIDGPIREPSCVGCYPAEPEAIRRLFRSYFVAEGGPGMPATQPVDDRLIALLVPHIDYARGNVGYAWGFKELFEHCDASLFVVIGTSHYSMERFTVTRKNFRTPLGIAETDQEYIDRLERHFGDGLFDDPLAHFPEHSIELEVVFLQYMYENLRPIRIVPIVVGPFRDCIEAGVSPSAQNDIRRMVAALQAAEAESGERICYVISGDLAHIGPKFGDPLPVSEPQLSHSRAQDQKLMQHAEAINVAGYYEVIASENDDRRICGLPPTFTVLEAAKPSSGRLLHYGQYVHPEGFESVSFASMAFYR